MSRALDVVTLTGEEYDDLIAQLSAAKDQIAELTPVAGMDWRETMQRMLTRMEETDRWPAICDEARAVLSLANDATREPAAYLWGGCLWRTDEMERGRPGAVELYRAQTPLTDTIYLGTVSKRDRAAWASKVDCTSKFIGALMDWTPHGTVRMVTDNHGNRYEIEVRKLPPERA